jgi:hypothetical protein
MVLRTLVSFEASAPKDGQPPGREVAERLARGLGEAGFNLQGPTEHEGWAWTPDRRPLGGIKTEKLDQQMRAWCEALHAALTNAPTIRSIRWYDRETFDRDHGETWFELPTD